MESNNMDVNMVSNGMTISMDSSSMIVAWIKIACSLTLIAIA